MRLAFRRRGCPVTSFATLAAALLLVPGSALRAQEEAAAPEEPKETAPSTRIQIALGTQRQTVDGNPQRYWQYVTPPSGTHVALVEVTHPLSDEGVVYGIRAYDLLEPSAGGVGYLYEVDQGLRIDTRYRRSQFYRDPYAGASHVTRKDWRTDARWRITPEDHLIAGYSTSEVRGAQDSWQREAWRATYTRRLGALEGYASFGCEQLGFAEDAPYLPGEAITWSLGFGPSRDARTLFAGTISATHTNLDGIGVSPNETFVSLSGFRQLTDDLTVSGDLKYWELSDAIAQNAYAKRERLAAIEGEWTGLPHTVIRAGFESAEMDYVNARQSQILQPAVNTGTVSVRIRPHESVKLQGDYTRRRVDGRPLAYDVGGNPITTRIYSQADTMRLRGNWTPSFAPIGLTAGYRRDERENEDQGTKNEIITRDLSAWWNVTDDVTATLSLMNQSYDLLGAGRPTPFVSDSRSWTLGAAWRISDRTSFETSFTRSDSFGAIELEHRLWSASLEHKWREHTLQLGVTLDDLDDFNGTLLGYDADLWYAEFSTLLP